MNHSILRDRWVFRFAAKLRELTGEEYNCDQIAEHEADEEARWWNSEDPDSWDQPEMAADLWEYTHRFIKDPQESYGGTE